MLVGPLLGGYLNLDVLLVWLLLILGFAESGGAEDACREVHWVSGSGPVRQRIRPNRKTPAHLASLVVQSRPRAWKRLRHVGFSVVSYADGKRRRYDQHDDGNVPAPEQDWEWDDSRGWCRPTSPGCTRRISR